MALTEIVCPFCGGHDRHHEHCSFAYPKPKSAPLTEQDIRRIVLDVLERVSESGSRFGFLQHRSLRTAIAAVRKEMGL